MRRRGMVFDAIGRGEVAEGKGHRSIFVGRPLDPITPTGGPGESKGREQIEASVVPLVLSFVGRKKIPPGGETNDPVVVAHAVPAGRGGPRLGKDIQHRFDEWRFFESVGGVLGRDAGDQTRPDRRRFLHRRSTVELDRIPDHLEIVVGSDASELRGTISSGVGAGTPPVPRTRQRSEGLEVEPEDRFVVHEASGIEAISLAEPTRMMTSHPPEASAGGVFAGVSGSCWASIHSISPSGP